MKRNFARNNRGQFAIIAALLVAVILISTLITTYSAVRSQSASDQPQFLSIVDETNLALKQLLGFTVGYYGSILRVTGNTTYAQEQASSWLNKGLDNIADTKPELGLAFRVTNLDLRIKWFMTSSYSYGRFNVTYDINSLGVYGLPYFLQSRLDMQLLPTTSGQPARVYITQDGSEPLTTLTNQNFKIYRYLTNLTTWDLIPLASDPQIFSNGTYLVNIPSGYGIDSTTCILEVTDSRGIVVVGSAFNGYSAMFQWSSPYFSSVDYIDQTSIMDGSADQGTHSSFNNQKAKDSSYDLLTEQNTGANAEQFVTVQSNVDGSADKGSHSSFNNQKAKDGLYDVLTEQNTGIQQNTFGNSAGISSYTTVAANYMYGSPFTSPSDAEGATIQNIIWYGRYNSFFGWSNAKAILLNSSKQIISVSNSISVSTTAQERTCTFSSPPTIHANTQYYLMMIFDSSTRFYYQTASNQGYYDITNSYNSPSNPTDGTTNNNQYLIKTTYQYPSSYGLDLEEQFTGVDFSQSNEWLCVYAGALGSESLRVDVYSGGSWVTLTPALVANQWNNVSVSTYLTSSTLTIRFKGAVDSGDPVQDTWNVDAVLVHTWSANYVLDLEEQFTSVDFGQSNEELCIYAGALGAESLRVDVYSGGSWVTVIPVLPANQWRNVSVSSYLTSSEFTFRFKGVSDASDAVQDTWQIDAVLLSLSSTIDPSSIQDSTMVVEWLQNGTLRMLGQGIQSTTQTLPIPPIAVKGIHLNQTFINGTNREVAFQIENWASSYNVPLGLTNNATVFSNIQMIVFVLTTEVSKVTIWWDGGDSATQTPYAYLTGQFTDNPVVGGTLNNGRITLKFPDSGFNVQTTTVGGVQSTTNFMRINTKTASYGAGYAFVISNGVVRDVVQQEPEWNNLASDCPNLYASIVLTLPAKASYFTYQLRLTFINSVSKARTITDLSPIQLSTSLTNVQTQTENGTSTVAPIIKTGTGTFINYGGNASLHHFSQFTNAVTQGTGILFTDNANQNLYFFDSKGTNPAITGALNVSSTAIELAPVTSLRAVLNYNTPNGEEIVWKGAIATFDSNRTPIYKYASNSATGLWVLVEYAPAVAVTPIS